MVSATKEAILQGFEQNELLNTVLPPVMIRNAHDLGADGLYAPLDERITASTVEALEAGNTHYVPVPGIEPLRASFAQVLNKSFGGNYQSANIVVTAGVQEARFLTIQKLSEQFERVALPAVVHPGARKAAGVRPLPIESMEVNPLNCLPLLDSIQNALDNGCKLLYLESPSRLTGAIYNPDEVAAIMAAVTASDAAVIWDQGLAAWVADGAYVGLSSQEGAAARVAIISEACAGMGLASWFIGYVAAPQTWLPPMVSQKQIMAICTSTPTQFAALEAINIASEIQPVQLKKLSQAHASLAQAAAGAQLTPIDGAAVNILACQLPAQQDEQIREALSKAGYSYADGKDFGAPNILRFSVALDAAAPAFEQLA